MRIAHAQNQNHLKFVFLKDNQNQVRSNRVKSNNKTFYGQFLSIFRNNLRISTTNFALHSEGTQIFSLRLWDCFDCCWHDISLRTFSANFLLSFNFLVSKMYIFWNKYSNDIFTSWEKIEFDPDWDRGPRLFKMHRFMPVKSIGLMRLLNALFTIF